MQNHASIASAHMSSKDTAFHHVNADPTDNIGLQQVSVYHFLYRIVVAIAGWKCNRAFGTIGGFVTFCWIHPRDTRTTEVYTYRVAERLHQAPFYISYFHFGVFVAVPGSLDEAVSSFSELSPLPVVIKINGYCRQQLTLACDDSLNVVCILEDDALTTTLKITHSNWFKNTILSTRLDKYSAMNNAQISTM